MTTMGADNATTDSTANSIGIDAGERGDHACGRGRGSDVVRSIEFSPTRKHLMMARLKAQAGIMQGAVRTRKGAFGGTKYATLESVLESVAEPLCANGLVLTQWAGPIQTTGIKGERRHVDIFTRIEHAESSEYMQIFVQILLTKDDAAGLGSAMTYGRRYGLKSCVGMPEIDDDGAAASGHESALRQPKKSAYAAKKEGGGEKYNEIAKAMREAISIDMLNHVVESYSLDAELLPESWRNMLNADYETKHDELTAKGAL